MKTKFKRNLWLQSQFILEIKLYDKTESDYYTYVPEKKNFWGKIIPEHILQNYLFPEKMPIEELEEYELYLEDGTVYKFPYLQITFITGVKIIFRNKDFDKLNELYEDIKAGKVSDFRPLKYEIYV